MSEIWDVLDIDGDKTGRLHERGQPMQKGDYHLVVHVWIVNSKREYLISKMVPGTKDISGKWQTTGGHAVAGDDSLTTALKETKEEIGITLDFNNGQLFKRYIEGCHGICDVWLFRQDVDIADVVLQPDETCDAMWAGKEKIMQMVDEGSFRPKTSYPYLEDLLCYS